MMMMVTKNLRLEKYINFVPVNCTFITSPIPVNDLTNTCKLPNQYLKAHTHLFGQFLNISIYYQQNMYTPYINLTKFEPLKPSRSGDISLLVLKICKQAVKQPCLDQKIYTMFILKIPILPVYILISHKIFRAFSYSIYPNVPLKPAIQG